MNYLSKLLCVLMIVLASSTSGFAEEKSAKLVSELFDVIYSNGSFSADLEARFFSKAQNDIRVCLRATDQYAKSEAPILEFLHDNRIKLFKTDERKRITVFSKCQLLDESTKNVSNEYVFAMVRWDRDSATPPVLMILFLFEGEEGGNLGAGPLFMHSEVTKTLYDLALERRDSTQ